MTNTEIIATIRNEIERRITVNTFGAKLELVDILAWLDTLESEKPVNPKDAMKELDEKIALVKQRGTWDGVDVDKYMDEVRGREPEKPIEQEELEEELERFIASGKSVTVDDCGTYKVSYHDFKKVARHFAQWGAEHASGSSEIPNDLEEAARRYGFEEYMRRCNGGEYGTSEDAFIAGAKWQKEQDTRDMLMSDNRNLIKCYEQGKKDMKEQMLKEAVEGEIENASLGIVYLRKNLVNEGYSTGDKVRVVVLKNGGLK